MSAGGRTGQRDGRRRLWIAFALLACALALSLCYWPGLVTYDSVRQYDQALSGAFDDWHPPAMEAIWRLILPIWTGPAPMLLLQLGLYAAGFVTLILWAARRERSGLAVAFSLCALLPLSVALMGEVLKDCLMAGALLLAAGLALPGLEGRRPLARLAAVALLLFAACLRFNAFTAALPILLVAVGPAWRATRLRIAVVALVGLVALLIAMPLANRALQAERSDVGLSLVIFDLAGITVNSGQNAFPELGLRDPVGVVRGCYTPVKWDSFSWWTDPLCPLDFQHVRSAINARKLSGTHLLAEQILRHPVAYVRHRLAHWNINARFLVPDEVERPVQRVSAPNDWGFVVPAGEPVDAIDRVAVASASTPLGWPCVWMALAFGLLLVSGRLRSVGAIRMLAGSALLYGLGYGVFSVASELRYYLWTMIAAALAFMLAASDLMTSRQAPRASTTALMIGPALLVALAAFTARIVLQS